MWAEKEKKEEDSFCDVDNTPHLAECSLRAGVHERDRIRPERQHAVRPDRAVDWRRLRVRGDGGSTIDAQLER